LHGDLVRQQSLGRYVASYPWKQLPHARAQWLACGTHTSRLSKCVEIIGQGPDAVRRTSAGKGYTYRLAERGLAHVQHDPAHAHPIADVDGDGKRLVGSLNEHAADLAADVTDDPAKPAAQQAQEGCSTSE
jgi:hypothetical protein